MAPGVYDMISAKMADSIGFDALYMTGSGTVASHLGVPDAGIATYTDMVSRAGRVASGTNTPLIADADTGYGGLVNRARDSAWLRDGWCGCYPDRGSGFSKKMWPFIRPQAYPGGGDGD